MRAYRYSAPEQPNGIAYITLLLLPESSNIFKIVWISSGFIKNLNLIFLSTSPELEAVVYI